jgi:DNA-binding winged helix-turn-helix (wHTH) protein
LSGGPARDTLSRVQYAFDDYVLDMRTYELRWRGVLRPLQPRPLDVLHYLVSRPDRVVTKAELLRAVWTGVHVTDNALAQAVAGVRAALADARRPAIASVRGRGYRFVLPVAVDDRSPAALVVALATLDGALASVDAALAQSAPSADMLARTARALVVRARVVPLLAAYVAGAGGELRHDAEDEGRSLRLVTPESETTRRPRVSA